MSSDDVVETEGEAVAAAVAKTETNTGDSKTSASPTDNNKTARARDLRVGNSSLAHAAVIAISIVTVATFNRAWWYVPYNPSTVAGRSGSGSEETALMIPMMGVATAVLAAFAMLMSFRERSWDKSWACCFAAATTADVAYCVLEYWTGRWDAAVAAAGIIGFGICHTPLALVAVAWSTLDIVASGRHVIVLAAASQTMAIATTLMRHFEMSRNTTKDVVKARIERCLRFVGVTSALWYMVETTIAPEPAVTEFGASFPYWYWLLVSVSVAMHMAQSYIRDTKPALYTIGALGVLVIVNVSHAITAMQLWLTIVPLAFAILIAAYGSKSGEDETGGVEGEGNGDGGDGNEGALAAESKLD